VKKRNGAEIIRSLIEAITECQGHIRHPSNMAEVTKSRKCGIEKICISGS
jgi:hypothetical protein